VLRELSIEIQGGATLSGAQVASAIQDLVDEGVEPVVKADFLIALARRGETPEEIAAFALELRRRAVEPILDLETRSKDILDVCGTGGDHQNTFNVSTTVAIVAASAGVTVAKHGNRAITSKAGSADVLKALGVPIELTPVEAGRHLHERQFAFFFAPNYHPAFRHIAPARKLCAERGQRTIFNFLGPLLNPARPTAQLVGVPDPKLCEPMARVLQRMKVRRAMVVSGCVPGPAGDGKPEWMDEMSPLGITRVAEFYHDRGFSVSDMEPNGFPFQRATLADLRGGDAAANAAIIRSLLDGTDRGPRRDAVLLNAAAALFVAGRVRSLVEGWELGAELLDSGTARNKLADIART
jgi:anthranilate phosphoribosyltransferase